MSDLQFNIARLQQCLDVTVGTPSVGDVVQVTSTSPLEFEIAPGGGGTGTVSTIVPEDPITVDSSDPANPIVGVKEADGAINQAGIVSDKNQTFNGKKTFLDIPRTENIPTDPDGWQLTNKKYVDTIAAGLQVKASVRAATLVPGNLHTDFQNGSIIDGVTLATGNRILIKNQTSAIENGIYTVNASSDPTRATDYDAAGEANSGTFTTVIDGGQKNTQWVQVNTGVITPGVSAINFSQLAISGNVNTIETPTGPKTGPVTLSATDIYYYGGTGITTWDKIETKAPLASPALTGTPTATTASQGNNSTRIATTAYVDIGLGNRQPSNSILTGLTALTGTSGFAKKTGASSWTLDTTAYATQTALTSGLATKQPLDTQAPQVIKVSLTSAQIKTLNSNPVPIFPGPPGVGKAYRCISVMYKYNYIAPVYTSANAVGIFASSKAITTGTLVQVNLGTILTATNSFITNSISPSVNVNGNIVENENLVFFVGSQNPIGGNSTLDVYITYQIINL